MDQAIEDGVGQGGIADVVMPVFDGQLAGDEGGGAAVTIFDDLQQVSAVAVIHGSKSQVIDDEDLDLGQFDEKLSVAAVGPCEGHLLEEPGVSAQVESAISFQAGLVCQGAGEEGVNEHAKMTPCEH